MIAGRMVDSAGTPRIANCLRTGHVFDRMRGLLGRPPPGPGSALLITPCAAIHTVGMRYPIDVVYLDAEEQVLELVEALAPWRWSACRRARAVLELAAGGAALLGIEPGLRLHWEHG